MPATNVVTFERHSQTARQLQPLSLDLPVQIHRTRLPTDFVQALRTGPFPIAILEAEADPDMLPALISQSQLYRASILVVGEPGGWNRQFLLRESGAHCLIEEPPSPARWQAILTRLISHSQERMQLCG